jgi:hypothetical protein
MQLVEPGVHGDVVTGTQGIGVSTPSAAAVADATAGFVGVMHIPNGGMFLTGTKSIMFAAGVVAITCFSGVTTNAEGAIPNEHIIAAPAVTWVGMFKKVNCYKLIIDCRVDGNYFFGCGWTVQLYVLVLLKFCAACSAAFLASARALATSDAPLP